jgi:hypothetical protein
MNPNFAIPQVLVTAVLLLPQPVQPTRIATYSQPDSDQAKMTLTARELQPIQPVRRIKLG